MGFLDQLANTIKSPFPGPTPPAIYRKDADYFSITELAGQKRVVHLRGNRLPKDKLPIGTKQRINKTYYAGHRVPTIQVLGATDDDLVIQGQINDRWMPKASGGEALQMRATLQDICARGNMVLVEWASYKKYCFIEHAEFEVIRENRADYKITFNIYGDSPAEPVRAELLANSLSQAVGQAKTLGDSIRTRVIPPMSQGFGQLLGGLINDIAQPLSDALGVVDAVANDAKEIAGSYAKLTGMIKNLNVKLRKLELTALQISMSVIQSTGNIADTWTAFAGNKRLASDARSLRHILDQFLHALDKIVATLPIGKHKVTDGETLQKISFKYYNDSTQWKKIKSHNNLTTDELSPGQILEIPR